MDDFLGVAKLVFEAVALINQIVQVAQNRAQVLAGGDGAPAANRVETHRHRALGQQRRRFVAKDAVGVVDAQNEERHAVGSRLAIGAGAASGGEFVCADNMLGAEVARAETIAAAVELWYFRQRNRGQPLDRLNSLGEGGANIAAQRIVAG